MKHTRDIAQIVGIVAHTMERLHDVVNRSECSERNVGHLTTALRAELGALKESRSRREKFSAIHVSICDDREFMRRELALPHSARHKKKIQRKLRASEEQLINARKASNRAECALGEKKADVRRLRGTCRVAKDDHRKAVIDTSMALTVLWRLVEVLGEISQ
jgi:hypothetical protein